jgi:hypothetical protein
LAALSAASTFRARTFSYKKKNYRTVTASSLPLKRWAASGRDVDVEVDMVAVECPAKIANEAVKLGPPLV